MSIFLQIRNRFHPLWRIRRTPWLFNFFKRLDFAVWTYSPTIQMKMRVMWFRDMSWLFDSVQKEPEFNDFFVQVCDLFKPKVFWDVGANLGWFTWLVNSKASLTHAVLFEPLPLNAKLLTETMAKNCFKHMSVIQAAVSDHCGEVSFKVDDKSGATSQIADIYDSSGDSAIAHTYGLQSEIRVRMTTLDEEIAKGAPVPDLLKMDIEEAEHLALQGAGKLLDLGRTIIAFECHRVEAIELLKSRQWHVFEVDKVHNYVAFPPALIEKAAGITQKLTRM